MCTTSQTISAHYFEGSKDLKRFLEHIFPGQGASFIVLSHPVPHYPKILANIPSLTQAEGRNYTVYTPRKLEPEELQGWLDTMAQRSPISPEGRGRRLSWSVRSGVVA